jgi:hypothetical protein
MASPSPRWSSMAPISVVDWRTCAFISGEMPRRMMR